MMRNVKEVPNTPGGAVQLQRTYIIPYLKQRHDSVQKKKAMITLLTAGWGPAECRWPGQGQHLPVVKKELVKILHGRCYVGMKALATNSSKDQSLPVEGQLQMK